jgi:transcriptional regulator with XRE-family HTH domain
VFALQELDEGTRTRVLRVAARLTQHDLALRANVDRRRLSEFERNQANALAADGIARVREVLANACNLKVPSRESNVANPATANEELEVADLCKPRDAAVPGEAVR